MAIKKQQKRSIEVALPAQNGGGAKAPKVKKMKLEKPLAETVQKAVKKPAPVPKFAVKKEKLGAKKPIPESIKKPVQANGVAPAKKVIKSEKSAAEQPKKGKAPLSPEAIAAKRLKNAEKLKKKNENRKEGRKEGGQYKLDKITLDADALQLRIKEIESRPEMTKTAKRKLGIMKKKLQIIEGTYVPKPKLELTEGTKIPKSAKRHLRKKLEKARKAAAAPSDSKVSVKVETGLKNKKSAAAAAVVKVEAKKATKTPQLPAKKGPVVKQEKKLVLKKEEPEDSDDDEEEDDDEESDEAEESSFMNTSGEIDDDDSEVDDEEEDEDEDDEEDDEEEDDEEEEEEEVKVPVKKAKKELEKPQKPQSVKKQITSEPEQNGDAGKKKRFVLFVGNLPYDASPEDIKKHFLTKVSSIASVRVPTKPGCNTPRGFAYVEVENDKDYEKGLSLHNTTLNGRRLNVEYTRGGSKSVGNRQDVVSKNKKLHAMRKQGMLAGSQKDGHKRNDRRQKQRQQGPA